MGDTTMYVSVHRYNSGSLVLYRTFSPHLTPCSKYYATKTIWSREEIIKRGINLLKVYIVEQLVDLFTKVLPITTLGYLIGKIMGW